MLLFKVLGLLVAWMELGAIRGGVYALRDNNKYTSFFSNTRIALRSIRAT